MYFQSKEVCAQLQDGLLKVTTELQTVREQMQSQSDLPYAPCKTNKYCLCVCVCVSLSLGMEDLLPVLLRLHVCRYEAEGCRETGGKTENQENGEVDRKSKTPCLNRLANSILTHLCSAFFFLGALESVTVLLRVIVDVGDTETGQGPGDPGEVQQGTQRIPPEPGRRQRLNEQVLPSGHFHTHRRECRPLVDLVYILPHYE